MPELVEIRGVGPVLAKACAERGFINVEIIAAAKVADFVAVPGVNEARARQLIDAAAQLLDGNSTLEDALKAANNVEAKTILAKQDDAKKKKTKSKSKKSKGKKNKSKSKKGKKGKNKKKIRKKKKNKKK